MAIFVYDKDKKKVVEVKYTPIPINVTKNHVNMRTTWSGTTEVEFNTITMDESIQKMNENN